MHDAKRHDARDAHLRPRVAPLGNRRSGSVARREVGDSEPRRVRWSSHVILLLVAVPLGAAGLVELTTANGNKGLSAAIVVSAIMLLVIAKVNKTRDPRG